MIRDKRVCSKSDDFRVTSHLPIACTGAMLFFQLFTQRYESASTIVTANKSLEEWGETFGCAVMAAALIDRLVHHGHREQPRQQLPPPATR